MTTAYTSLLGLALPVTGELSGTWGDTVNDYITQYLDASVAGTQTISGSQTAVTLSKTTNASLSQAGSGATGSSQYNVINCTGNPASMLTVTVPAASKTYVVVNATSTNQDVKIVGAGPTTGVTLVAGERAIIAWNGSDFIKVATSTVDGVSTISFGTTGLTPSTATSGAVTVAGTLVAANGGTGQSSYTTGDLLYATGSTALSKLGIGTNGQILTSTGTAPQWSTLSGVAVTTFSAGTTGFTPSSATSGAVTLAGTLATTNGGTGLTAFTANRVFYASSTSAIGSSANLTFDGTTLTANALTTTSTVTINGGTANGVAYLNGSKVLTTGSALTFNGTNFSLLTGGVASIFDSSVNNRINLGADASGAYIQSTFSSGGSTDLRFLQASTEAMRLNTTGLGIGTSSPSVKLDVFGRAKIDVGTYASGYALTLGAISETGRTYQIGMVTGGSLAIYDSAAAAQRVVLDSSGNLGIGTSSPGSKLDVQGGSINTSSFVTITPTTTTLNAIYRATNTGGTFYAGLDNSAGGVTGTAYAAMIWHTGAYPISFGTNNTLRATLDSSGNLGIGTSSPITRFNVVDSVTNTFSAAFRGAGGSNIVGLGTTSGGAAIAGYTAGFAAATDLIVNPFGGNLGLGVTPSAWAAYRALQVGRGSFTSDLSSSSTIGTIVGCNWLYDGANKYIINGFGSFYQQDAGQHRWWTAGNNTSGAGAAMSPTQAMTLDASGNLMVGSTSSSAIANKNIDVNGTGDAAFVLRVGGTTTAYFYSIASQALLGTSGAVPITFNPNGTERARITSGGDLLVGRTSRIITETFSSTGYGLFGGATVQGIIGDAGSGLVTVGAYSNHALEFRTNNTERARITSVGNLSLGGTANRGTTVGTNAIQIFNGTAPAGTLTNGVSLYSASGDLNFMDAAGNGFKVGYRNLPPVGTQTGSYTLAAGDVGKYVQVGSGGSITVPTSVFAEGDAITLYNNTTGNITITCSAVTAYTAGTNTVKTSMTLATRGVATILFYSATACVISGNVT